MTSDGALLRLGESVVGAVCDALRRLGAGDVQHGPVTIAPKGELALQDLPPLGVVCSAAYANAGTGGNVVVLPRRAARSLVLLTRGAGSGEAGEGPIASEELAEIREAAGALLLEAGSATAALVGGELELAEPAAHAYDTPGQALTGLDLSPRATSVTITAAGESFRLVHLIPNALLIRMTQVLDDRAAAGSGGLADGTEPAHVPAEKVREVTLTLRAELGRTRLSLLHASSLEAGAAVTLDRRVDDPVELYVNGRRFGRGELVAQGGRFAVRITEITGVSPTVR